MNRTIAALVSVASLMLLTVVLFNLLFDSGGSRVARAAATGEILSPITLAANERVEIDYSSACCGGGENWTFVLFGGEARRLAVIDAGGSFYRSTFRTTEPSPIGAITLSERECRGLRDLFQLYRLPNPRESSTTTVRVRVSYFRGSTKVGAELFVNHGYEDEWIYRRAEGEQIPAWSRVTPDMVSFRQLVARAAQADQPDESTLAVKI